MTLNPIVHFDPVGGMTVITILISPFLFNEQATP
jgi:hypothetical protein